ncbi:MAG: hypothetical protein ACR2GA_00600 [Chloroflexota bacterium]
MTTAALIVGLLAPFSAMVTGTGSAAEEQDQEAVIHHGVTLCGVERWTVKTGTDYDARLVNRSAPFNTTIFRLRSLTAPSSLPFSARIQPVETTLYRLPATIIRSKIEADSDVHLVLSDSGGRTMIAEIPAPQCVGSNSPFRGSIAYVRRTFTSRYHPVDSWQRRPIAVAILDAACRETRHSSAAGSSAGDGGAHTFFGDVTANCPNTWASIHPRSGSRRCGSSGERFDTSRRHGGGRRRDRRWEPGPSSDGVVRLCSWPNSSANTCFES